MTGPRIDKSAPDGRGIVALAIEADCKQRRLQAHTRFYFPDKTAPGRNDIVTPMFKPGATR